MGRGRPGRFRRWVLRPVLWGLTLVAVLIFLLQLFLDTRRARDWTRKVVAEKLGAYLERQVTIEDIQFELLPFNLEVWGLEISGPEGEDTPFLRIPWASVEGDLSTLQEREVRLRQIRVERPEIYVHFLPDGAHNLLNLRRKQRPKRRFDVYIDRLEVDKANFVLEQDSVRLSASADEVRARLRGLGELHLDGQVSAQNLLVRLPDARPQALSIAAEGEFRRGRLDIRQAKATGTGFEAEASGLCEWERLTPEKKCLIQVRGQSQGTLLARLGYFQELEGLLSFTGNVGWRPGSSGWRGRVEAPRLRAWGRELDGVAGTLIADRYGARFDIQEASYAGGEIRGIIDAKLQQEGDPVTVDLQFAGLRLDTVIADQKIPVEGLASLASGQLTYRFPRKDAEGGDGHGELSFAADREHPGLPLEGTFPIRIESGVLRSDSIRLTSERQSALAQGWYDFSLRQGRFDYEVGTTAVAELTDLLPLSEELRLEPPLWLPVKGEGNLSGTLYLAPEGATSDIQMQLSNVTTSDFTLDRASGGLHATTVGVERLRLDLVSGDGAMTVSGRVPFTLEGDPFGMVLGFDAVDCSMEQIKPWLAFPMPLDGKVSGRLDLQVGDERANGRLRASLEPARWTEGRLEGLTVDRLRASLAWDSEQMQVDDLQLDSSSGRINGQGRVDWAARELDLQLKAPSLRLGRKPLRGLLPHGGLDGEIDLVARLGGTFERPSLRLSAVGDRFLIDGRPLGGESSVELDWDGQQLDASGSFLDLVALSGGGSLDRESADLSFGLEGTDVARLLELFTENPPEEVGGAFSGAVTVAGDLGDEGPEVVLGLDRLEISYRDRALRNLEPVRVELDRDQAFVSSLYLGEIASESELFLRGTLSFAPGAPLDLLVQSSLAATWLELYTPRLDLEGNLNLLGKLSGTLADPYFDGQGDAVSVRVLMPESDFPHSIDEGRGILQLYRDKIEISDVHARMAGGQISGEGTLELGGEAAHDVQLRLTGEDLSLRYPEGWLLRGDTALTITGLGAEERALQEVEASWRVAGQAQLRRIEYTEDVAPGFEQLLRLLFERQRLEVDETDDLLASIQLSVSLEAPRAVRVRNNLADLTGDADLVLRGTAARPILEGEVDIDPGSTLNYNSTEYAVQRGRVIFANPSVIEPELDLVATTRVRDFDITLALKGPLDRIEPNFSSEPPLPGLEVFRMLASGDDESFETASVREPTDARDQEGLSAATFLYGQAASLVGQRVGTLFGLDKFRIDPLTGSGDSISTARVTVGKRLSKDLSVTYSVDPASTEEQRLRLEWEVDGGLVLVFTQNGDDSYSVDARWERSF